VPHSPNMLEEIAIQYVSQSEDNLRLIGYGITIAGAVIAAFFHKSQSELGSLEYDDIALLIKTYDKVKTLESWLVENDTGGATGPQTYTLQWSDVQTLINLLEELNAEFNYALSHLEN